MTLLKTALALLLVTTFSIALPLAAQAGELLDGKVFTTMLDGKSDVLTFQDGTFHSSACDEWGFGKGNYSTKTSTDGISFMTVTTSVKDGKMVWRGMIRGETIQGGYVWSKKGWFGKNTKANEFKGNLNH